MNSHPFPPSEIQEHDGGDKKIDYEKNLRVREETEKLLGVRDGLVT